MLGHGPWALAVGGAASSWEVFLSASLAQLWVCALLMYVRSPSVGEERSLTRMVIHSASNTYLRTCSNLAL